MVALKVLMEVLLVEPQHMVSREAMDNFRLGATSVTGGGINAVCASCVCQFG